MLNEEIILKFQLQKSYWLCLVILFIHLGAIFCIYFTPLIFWGKITATLCVLANLTIVTRAYALLNSSHAVIEFWHTDSEDWYLKKRSGDVELASIEFPIFISDYLIVLNFAIAKKFLKTSVPIAKDAFLTEDDLRRFKVLLRTTRF
ncbi:MAG: hypothetical protein ACD_21C00268G0009 [uncultured bacterium]|nr:MAG: hypothetical protein ACD_21C00268G0009 [uncultured bacterium]